MMQTEGFYLAADWRKACALTCESSQFWKKPSISRQCFSRTSTPWSIWSWIRGLDWSHTCRLGYGWRSSLCNVAWWFLWEILGLEKSSRG